ncbi:MAG: RES family NAD+ phosphorylase [Parvibaculaceae bacterium]
MRLARIGPDAIFYRFLSPRWAFLPTSGAGAAQNGGRFNRPGVEALYLAADPATALAEYRQDASIVPPGILVAYRVALADVVDFSSGYDPAAWPSVWENCDCDWKFIARIEHRDPPTWHISDQLVQAGRRGLLYPSMRHPGGINLALFLANLDAEDSIEPHDPDHRLPHDQRSWDPR